MEKSVVSELHSLQHKPNYILDNLYVIPVMTSVDPCCQYLLDKHIPAAQEYAFILDFDRFR